RWAAPVAIHSQLAMNGTGLDLRYRTAGLGPFPLVSHPIRQTSQMGTNCAYESNRVMGTVNEPVAEFPALDLTGFSSVGACLTPLVRGFHPADAVVRMVRICSYSEKAQSHRRVWCSQIQTKASRANLGPGIYAERHGKNKTDK